LKSTESGEGTRTKEFVLEVCDFRILAACPCAPLDSLKSTASCLRPQHKHRRIRSADCAARAGVHVTANWHQCCQPKYSN